VGVVVLLLAGGAYFVTRRRAVPATAAVETPVLPSPAPKAATESKMASMDATNAPPPSTPAVVLPEIGQSDDFMREHMKALSDDARLAVWLKTDNIVRRLAAATDLISAGKIPADSFSFLGSRTRFKAVAKHGKSYISPRSYARYDGVASTLSSIDAKGAGTLFAQTRPLIQQACQELGDKTCDYRDTLVRAIGELLEAPVPAGDVEVNLKDNGIIYTFADPKLEQLDPVQKELVRMGPANELKIQNKLREFAGAVGVSADQLPKGQ
jgi:hypothetical protein